MKRVFTIPERVHGGSNVRFCWQQYQGNYLAATGIKARFGFRPISSPLLRHLTVLDLTVHSNSHGITPPGQRLRVSFHQPWEYLNKTYPCPRLDELSCGNHDMMGWLVGWRGARWGLASGKLGNIQPFAEYGGFRQDQIRFARAPFCCFIIL